MVHKEVVRIIVGIIGNCISFGLFLSPIPTFVKIVKEKTVGGFKPDPYLAILLNCMTWVLYGLPFVHSGSTLVLTINGTGTAIQIVFIIIFLSYSTWSNRVKIAVIVLVEVVFMVAISVITLKVFHTESQRSSFVGPICVIFCVLMYVSPLTIMARVIKTKSVRYMPFLLSVANLANGITWTAYSLLRFDLYILIPNGLGVVSGILQLVLYATYYHSTNWVDDHTTRTTQAQTQILGP